MAVKWILFKRQNTRYYDPHHGLSLLEAALVEIGEKITNLRQEKNLTQRKLAEKAGISVSYLKKIEEGHYRKPHLKLLAIIAYALEIDLKTILGE